MEGIINLSVLVGVLCVSIGLGLAFEMILIRSIFKLLPQREGRKQ
jgi:hypothetical protein